MENNIYKKVEHGIGIYSILLIIAGTLGNLLAFFVCLRKNNRNTPTFIFTAFALIADTISLYWWNLDHYLLAFYNYLLEDISIHLCRTTTLFQCFSLQWSSWLLVFMTVERYLSVQFKKWRLKYFKSKEAVIASVVLGVTLFVLNLSLVLEISYDTKVTNITCYASEQFSFIMQVNIFAYGCVPYVFMLVSNILLIYRVVYSKESTSIQRNRESNEKRKSLSITVLILTNIFIFASTPVNVVNAFFLDLLGFPYGYTVFFLCDCLVFSHQALHFLTLMLSNKQFAKELKSVLREIGVKNKVDTILATESTTGTGNLRNRN